MGNITFGFRLASDGHHLEPEPAEQAAFAEIRRLRHEGADAVRDRRRPEPPGPLDAPGTPWRLESVARVLGSGSCSTRPV